MLYNNQKMSEYYKMTGQKWESVISGDITELKSPDGLEVTILNAENVRNALLPENSEKPLVIFISGTSESGKSTFGKLAVKTGIAHRLKIYKTLAETAGEEDLPDMEDNPFNYATSLESNPRLIEKAGQRIISKYVNLMLETDVPAAIVETIKHKWMVGCFRSNPNIRFLSIVIDADLEKRIRREATKTGRPIEEVRADVLKKDEWKQELGSKDVESTADVYILNNGDYNTYEKMVISFLRAWQKKTRSYSGKAHDYSLD